MKFYCCVIIFLVHSINSTKAQSLAFAFFNINKNKIFNQKNAEKIKEKEFDKIEINSDLPIKYLSSEANENSKLNDFIKGNILKGASNFCLEFENIQTKSTIKYYRGSTDTNIKFWKINGLVYGASYKINLISFSEGTWSTNNQSCEITLPEELPEISLDDSFCGSTGIDLNEILHTNYNDHLSEVHWIIENTSLNYFSEKYTYNNSIRLNDFEGLRAGVTYSVKLSARINDQWSAYGENCSITVANSIPSIIYDEMGYEKFDFPISQNIQCNSVTDAAYYQWTFKDCSSGTDCIATTIVPNVLLADVVGLLSNSMYTIKVRSKIKDNWQNYGPDSLICISDADIVQYNTSP